VTARRLSAALLALALALTLTGCWDEAPDDTTDDFWAVSPEEIAPVPDEPAFTAFTLPYLPGQTLDPITCSDGVQQTVSRLLYEGLFVLDEHFALQPMLCADYACDETATSFSFTPRAGAIFSDGSPLTAADILATYRRAATSPRYAARFANVSAMWVRGGALMVTLARPDSAFPALLDIPIVKSGSEKNTVPLGTGPYLFATDSAGPCLIRNENWWSGEDVPLGHIALTAAKDTDSAAYLFSAHGVNLIAADLLSSTPAAALSGAEITDAQTSALLFLGVNTRRAPLDDAALRREMSRAFDREAIVTTLLAGHARATQFPIPPASVLYPAALEAVWQSPTYANLPGPPAESDGDTEVAPGWTLTLLVNAENPFKVSLCEYLCRQLSAGSVTVSPRVLPWADYTAALEDGDFDLYLGEMRLTADWDVSALVGAGGTLNYGGWADERTDAALEAFLAAETPATAAAFCRVLAQEAPILPIAFKSLSLLTPEGLCSGMSPTGTDPFYRFPDWEFAIGAG